MHHTVDLAAHADTLDHLERAISERDHWRAMYRAVYGLCCDALVEGVRKDRRIAELMDERERFARQIFGRTPADAPGEIEP